MFKDEWAALGGMALEAGFVVTEQHGAATFHALRQTRSTAFDRVALVRVVAIRAAHFALEHRMVMRKLKGSTDVGVTLETGRRRFSRIHDLRAIAAALDVETPGAMTRFAAHRFGVAAVCLEP